MEQDFGGPRARQDVRREPESGSELDVRSWTVAPAPEAARAAADDLELIAACYESAAQTRSWRDLLALLCDRFGAAAGALCAHDFVTGQGELLEGFNIPDWLRDSYNGGLAAANPWLGSAVPYRPLSVSTGDEICGTPALCASDFYRDFLGPQGLLHRLCGVVSSSGSRVQYISLLRSREARPFGPRDKTALAPVLPYVARAIALRRKLQRGRHERRDLRGLMAQLPVPCLLVDRETRLRTCNCAAERLLESASALTLGSGRVIARTPRESARLHELVRAIADGDRAEGRLVLRRKTGALPLLCIVLPLVAPADRRVAPERRSVALLVKDLQSACEVSTDDFAAAFGLTAAESRLVALLGAGSALFEAAGQLGITRSTARTHMRNIYGKVGMNRQTDIVRLLERFALF